MTTSRLAFILSAPRSGSTLLIRILDSHSRIAAPCELGLPHVMPGSSRKYKLVLEKLREICTYYDLGYERALGDAQYLFSGMLDQEKKECLVVKDPRHSVFVPEIDSRYSPRFICLLRDARGVANSSLFQGNPEEGLRLWRTYYSSVARDLEPLPAHRKHFLKYEELVRNPATAIDHLLSFLGYAFEPGMLEYRNFAHADDRMKLWRGEFPKDSFLQEGLYAAGIDRDYADTSRWSDRVRTAYERMPRVRKLNEGLGYV